MADEAKSATPTGPPPEVTPADSTWRERPTAEPPSGEPTEPASSSEVDVALGAQVFGVSGKAMSGLSLRFGHELYWGELEFTPIWLTQTSPDFDGRFVGNQWAFYFSLAPLRTRYVEALGGVGIDVYHLWGIHGDEALTALSFKAQVHFRPTTSTSIFATVRSYALHSGGLELGAYRNSERAIPALAAVGGEWRFE